MGRELLFSVTENDLIIQTFKDSGPGGQNRNKRETAVRITHKASGAVGVATESREQKINKHNALVRMSESKIFKAWVNKVSFEMQHHKTAEQLVEEDTTPDKLKVEGVNESGKWVTID